MSSANDKKLDKCVTIALAIIGVLSLAFTAVIIAGAATATPSTDHAASTAALPSRWESTVSSSFITQVLQRLQTVAEPSRVIGSVGFDRTVEMVRSALTSFGVYKVWLQPFNVTSITYHSPLSVDIKVSGGSSRSISGSAAVKPMTGTAVGVVEGEVRAPANYGCDDADYTSSTFTSSVAFVRRGDCTFRQKAEAAAKAGAVAAVIYNQGNGEDRMGVFSGTLGAPHVSIPTVAMSYTEGSAVVDQAETGSVTATVIVNASYVVTAVNNVVGEVAEEYLSAAGVAQKPYILVGAHTDSVSAGPGLNDNGSGTAGVLELARSLSLLLKSGARLASPLVFAFFGAEEEGLLGSEHFVADLISRVGEEGARERISAMFNFDMIGSPNGVYGVYQGSEAEIPSIRNASATLEDMFSAYFEKEGVPHTFKAFNGRSDYGPFIEAGIPAGGVETGAEVKKTEEEMETFGGLANAAYDPCYHQSCDTFYNVDREMVTTITKSAAKVVGTLAILDDVPRYLARGNEVHTAGSEGQYIRPTFI